MSTATIGVSNWGQAENKPRRRRDDGLHLMGSNAPQRQPERRTHVFVHTVRFWSMVAIIAMHSLPPLHIAHTPEPWRMQLLMQPFKFGTIGFFLISGLLMGERLEACRPLDYLRRRLGNIFLPWLFWVLLLAVYMLATDGLHHRLVAGSAESFVASASHALMFCVRRTPFWFVPNLFIGMTCLLVLRRHLRDWRVGALLLAINLFYVVNIYAQWLPSAHTDATLGFAFYLWLGTYVTRSIDKLQGWVMRVPLGAWLAATALAGAGALAESRWLQHLSSVDPMNTLRLSNQVFSVVVVLVLLRLRRRSWPRWVDVPNNTFGLYLTHPLAMIAAFSLLHHAVAPQMSMAGACAVWAGTFVFVYAASLTFTRMLAATPGLEVLVGAKLVRATVRSEPLALLPMEPMAASAAG